MVTVVANTTEEGEVERILLDCSFSFNPLNCRDGILADLLEMVRK